MASLPYITAENAAEIARNGWVLRKARKEQEEAQKLSPSVEQQEADNRRKLRLLRIRKQQDRIDGMLLVETDPAKLDRLASAAARLNEQERQLSNRSLPPVLKASPAPRKSRATDPIPEPDAE